MDVERPIRFISPALNVVERELRLIVVKTSEEKGRSRVRSSNKGSFSQKESLGKKTFVCENDAEEEWIRIQKES